MTLTVVWQVRYRGVDVTQDDILVSVAVISGCGIYIKRIFFGKVSPVQCSVLRCGQ